MGYGVAHSQLGACTDPPKMKRILLLVAIFAYNDATEGVAPPSTCRYWCRTPEGQAYCCENINQPQSTAGVVKPGFCPPVRPVCPLRSFQPPFTCSNDGACGGIDKCCFDRCLGEHVCKAPLGIGR
nr:uncharacterized protein LOC113802963 [Penaeus vannamei]